MWHRFEGYCQIDAAIMACCFHPGVSESLYWVLLRHCSVVETVFTCHVHTSTSQRRQMFFFCLFFIFVFFQCQKPPNTWSMYVKCHDLLHWLVFSVAKSRSFRKVTIHKVKLTVTYRTGTCISVELLRVFLWWVSFDLEGNGEKYPTEVKLL